MRKNISGGSPWEVVVGYSRAVRIGNTIEVAGTTAIKDGKPYGVGDPYKQTKHILETIKQLIEKEGFLLKDIVRTRMFVSNIDHWAMVGKTRYHNG